VQAPTSHRNQPSPNAACPQPLLTSICCSCHLNLYDLTDRAPPRGTFAVYCFPLRTPMLRLFFRADVHLNFDILLCYCAVPTTQPVLLIVVGGSRSGEYFGTPKPLRADETAKHS
jgi:hypothetical protein